MNHDDVYKSLVAQLEVKGADVEHFVDLVTDYMTLWDIKEKLEEDIEERGTLFEGEDAMGEIVLKNNPSVKEFLNVNRQMLTILKQLEITTDTVSSVDEDEEM